MRPHGRRRGCPQGGEGRWGAVRALSYRPFWSFDGRPGEPVVFIRSVQVHDLLSKGRVVVGIGVGWMREEFIALGLPPFAERGAVTDEYLQIFKELWTTPNPSFQGQYCQFDDLDFLPKP